MPKPHKPASKPAEPTPRTTKLDQLIALLQAPDGASMDQMVAATNWQQHSIRGAMAGALRKKGFKPTSGMHDGVRRWRLPQGGGDQ